MTEENEGEYSEDIVNYLITTAEKGSLHARLKSLRILRYLVENGSDSAVSELRRNIVVLQSISSRITDDEHELSEPIRVSVTVLVDAILRWRSANRSAELSTTYGSIEAATGRSRSASVTLDQVATSMAGEAWRVVMSSASVLRQGAELVFTPVQRYSQLIRSQEENRHLLESDDLSSTSSATTDGDIDWSKCDYERRSSETQAG